LGGRKQNLGSENFDFLTPTIYKYRASQSEASGGNSVSQISYSTGKGFRLSGDEILARMPF